MFMSTHVEQIKEKLGIVDVVSSYIKLEKAGANFRAKCPFHNEKTPSFFVSPSRNSYYCFGCGVKGDIFSFVEGFEGTDFKGALKTLAKRAGVELTPINKKDEDRRTRLYDVLEEATLFFEKNLQSSKDAHTYLLSRGITKDTIATWRLGYSLPEWKSAYSHLTDKGYTEKELLEAGLIKRSEKSSGYYDRFRGRVMFPIMDAAERVIAYSGRILPEDSNSEYKESSAKYINSPETVLYEKSRVLYGYNLAKNTIRKHDFSILVEGQMDVVLSSQAGYTNTVAVSGTALTADQLSLIARLSNNVVVAFDGDVAGISAGGRGIDLALSRGMDVKVAALDKGKDPADLIKEDADTWKQVVRSAKHVIDFYLEYLSGIHADVRKLRLAVEKIVIPYVVHIPSRIDQAHFVGNIASSLKIAEDPVWDSVRSFNRVLDTSVETIKTKVNDELSSRPNLIETRLLSIFLWQDGLAEDKRNIDIKKLHAGLSEIIGEDSFKKKITDFVDKGDSHLFEIERLYSETENLEEEVEELCADLSTERLKDDYRLALNDLKIAEKKGDTKAVEDALKLCRKLSEKLHA